MTPLVSVVIPTYRRPQLLTRCLNAVLDQQEAGFDYEVIVVDDEPSDETRGLVESLENSVRIRYLQTSGHQGPAVARNLGASSAAGAILAFTDDDCIPDQRWLKAGVSAFQEGVSGVSGQVLVPLSQDPTDFDHNLAGLERSLFVTANCFYRKDDFEGFDERFEMPWREDSDLYFTLLEKGLVLARQREAIVLHPTRPAPWGVSVREQRKTMYNALLYKKHAELYRATFPVRAPLAYYSAVLGLGSAIVGLGFGIRLLGTLGGCLWLVQTLALAVRRLKHTSRRPAHVAEMVLTSAVIPPLSLYWRLRGAVRFRVVFF